MTKRADHSTTLSDNGKQLRSQAVPQTGKNNRDARENDETLAHNQKDLGVSSDHKTEDMEKGNRGTFP